MIRNAFDLCFHRVSGGDESYLEKFCNLLADRRLVVPVTVQSTDTQEYQFLLILRKNDFFVPAFLNEAMARFWVSKLKINCRFVSIRGADLAARIDENISVVINLGQIQIVELNPHVLETMAIKQSELDRVVDEFDGLELETLKKIRTVSTIRRPVVTLLEGV
jgi:SseB protein N-terminal domain